MKAALEKAKEFHSKEEYSEFALKYYGQFAESLGDIRSGVGSIQGSGRYLSEPIDKYCIKCITEMFTKCPETPFDLIAYRCGDMYYKDRPYLSAALVKSCTERYGDNPHKILIKKGSKIFPLRALSYIYGDSPTEIIIITKQLKKKKDYYEYR